MLLATTACYSDVRAYFNFDVNPVLHVNPCFMKVMLKMRYVAVRQRSNGKSRKIENRKSGCVFGFSCREESPQILNLQLAKIEIYVHQITMHDGSQRENAIKVEKISPSKSRGFQYQICPKLFVISWSFFQSPLCKDIYKPNP